MVVQHNLTAMNSNRMLGLTTSSQAKSTEKLSSGYKINRAADDAAGLSISEKMRKQIRGLTQATANAQDGISAVQTAEGALNEVQDMLQRMNELAVKASNGTMSENDRSYVQNEIDQLVTEVDRVAETTKFNETYLLKGDSEGQFGAAGTVAVAGTNISTTANALAQGGDYALGTVGMKGTVTGAGLGTLTADDDNANLKEILNNSSTGTVTFTATEGADTALANSTWDASVVGNDGITRNYSIKGSDLGDYGISFSASVVATNDTVVVDKVLAQSDTQKQDLKVQGLTYTAASATQAGLKDVEVGKDLLATISVDESGVATVGAYNPNAKINALDLSLQVGADSTSNNKIGLEIDSMNAKSLGLRTNTGAALKVDGKDSTNADAAIDTIAEAIQKVSTQRSALGAVQNRLEHTINNLGNVVENTTSAEAAIRDTDMATEMVKYANNNILAQAGTSMLAQANQSNQTVLSLLG